MDTFTAIPVIQRFPLTVVDEEKLPDFYASENIDEPIPTKTQIFVGYEKGPGTPVPVQIEVDRISTEYADNLPTDDDETNLTPNEYADKWRRVNMLLRRNLLLAVIRGLSVESANILAHEDSKGREILARLGWISAPNETVASDESATENKAEGEVETGESTSSISPQFSKE